MRTITIHNAINYPDYNIYISRNSFGDQCWVLIYEHIDGSKETLWTATNHEGSHESDDVIIERAYRLMKNNQQQRLSKMWGRIADALTLKQLGRTMGLRNYKAKALFVRDHVSKSESVKALCENLIAQYENIFTQTKGA